MATADSETGSLPEPDFGFNRIVHGWTNYSTSFSATYDGSPGGEFATVASVFTPAVSVQPLRFGVIVVWFGSGGQRLNFGNFTYKVLFWTSLEQFVANPREGDLATYSFLAPSGGSTIVPDATTLGGRAAYYLQFDLPTNPALNLEPCHDYYVGFAATATTSQAGELLVPTGPDFGPSDVQAGNIVPFGWIYLVDAGGQTVYFGRLATELAVAPVGERPRLAARLEQGAVILEWPEAFRCYQLESREPGALAESWLPVDEPPLSEGGVMRLVLPNQIPEGSRWFRLNRPRGFDVSR